jgi:hypothetical protein
VQALLLAPPGRGQSAGARGPREARRRVPAAPAWSDRPPRARVRRRRPPPRAPRLGAPRQRLTACTRAAGAAPARDPGVGRPGLGGNRARRRLSLATRARGARGARPARGRRRGGAGFPKGAPRSLAPAAAACRGPRMLHPARASLRRASKRSPCSRSRLPFPPRGSSRGPAPAPRSRRPAPRRAPPSAYRDGGHHQDVRRGRRPVGAGARAGRGRPLCRSGPAAGARGAWPHRAPLLRPRDAPGRPRGRGL